MKEDGKMPSLASWVTAERGHRHLCVLVESRHCTVTDDMRLIKIETADMPRTWFALCGGIVLITEDGPRIPPRCPQCLERRDTPGLVIVPAEKEIRI